MNEENEYIKTLELGKCTVYMVRPFAEEDKDMWTVSEVHGLSMWRNVETLDRRLEFNSGCECHRDQKHNIDIDHIDAILFIVKKTNLNWKLYLPEQEKLQGTKTKREITLCVASFMQAQFDEYSRGAKDGPEPYYLMISRLLMQEHHKDIISITKGLAAAINEAQGAQ